MPIIQRLPYPVLSYLYPLVYDQMIQCTYVVILCLLEIPPIDAVCAMEDQVLFSRLTNQNKHPKVVI